MNFLKKPKERELGGAEVYRQWQNKTLFKSDLNHIYKVAPKAHIIIAKITTIAPKI